MTDPTPRRVTDRLVMRAFGDADRERFAVMNADPQVMAYYPATLSREQSDAFVDRVAATWEQRGFGLWALERRDAGAFIGYAGLWPVPEGVPVEPKVEVGWRLAACEWGRGYAAEAARESVAFAFDKLGLAQLVSFTSVENRRSRAVMERIGMVRDAAGDFDHPALPLGHRLCRHVLYRAVRPASSAAQTVPRVVKPTRS